MSDLPSTQKAESICLSLHDRHQAKPVEDECGKPRCRLATAVLRKGQERSGYKLNSGPLPTSRNFRFFINEKVPACPPRRLSMSSLWVRKGAGFHAAFETTC